MIAHLTGKLLFAGVNFVVVDAGGVGYQVSVPFSLMPQLPVPGEEVSLHIHTQVREDAIQLFGFPEREDQEVFELLLGVTGVGPKVALGIMSVIATDTLTTALAEGDAATLQRVPGVGPKLAQRIVLELKDKAAERAWTARLAPGAKDHAAEAMRDAVEALMALGYAQASARKAAEQAADSAGKGADVAGIVRAALRILTRS